MTTEIYLVREAKSSKIRYAFTNDYFADSLKDQIELIEGIDIKIEKTTSDKLNTTIKRLVDSDYMYHDVFC